jgi:hypothetical protein
MFSSKEPGFDSARESSGHNTPVGAPLMDPGKYANINIATQAEMSV